MRACVREVPRVLSILTADGEKGEDRGDEEGEREKSNDDTRAAGNHETVPLDAYACTAARMPQTNVTSAKSAERLLRPGDLPRRPAWRSSAVRRCAARRRLNARWLVPRRAYLRHAHVRVYAVLAHLSRLGTRATGLRRRSSAVAPRSHTSVYQPPRPSSSLPRPPPTASSIMRVFLDLRRTGSEMPSP